MSKTYYHIFKGDVWHYKLEMFNKKYLQSYNMIFLLFIIYYKK
jgi:hypothetical protein